MSASQLKSQGNSLFSAGQYPQAVECYSKAMLKDPSEAKFYGNRALCYNRMQRYQESLVDCHRAIQLNARYAKAFYFQGEALIGLEKFDEAVESLQQALQLAYDQRLYFGDEISAKIKLARKKRWEQKEAQRLEADIELQTFLKSLLADSRKRSPDSHITPVGDVDAELESRLAQIEELFAQVDERRMKREVPDYLCCQISYDLMRDPVITPSGVTYERSSIEAHLERVGHFDPFTRSPLERKDLIPNLALKEIVQEFVANNEWVNDY